MFTPDDLAAILVLPDPDESPRRRPRPEVAARLAAVLYRRFCEPGQTLKALAAEQGVSTARIRQMLDRGLEALNAPTRRHALRAHPDKPRDLLHAVYGWDIAREAMMIADAERQAARDQQAAEAYAALRRRNGLPL